MSVTREGIAGSGPGPDDDVPDSIDRELLEPLGFDLSAFEVEEPSPDATERVVETMARTLAQMRAEAAEDLDAEPTQPSIPSLASAGREQRRRAPPVKDSPDPYRVLILPPEQRLRSAGRR